MRHRVASGTNHQRFFCAPPSGDQLNSRAYAASSLRIRVGGSDSNPKREREIPWMAASSSLTLFEVAHLHSPLPHEFGNCDVFRRVTVIRILEGEDEGDSAGQQGPRPKLRFGLLPGLYPQIET